MKPLQEWQLNEILDMELRKPQWHILLNEKGEDIIQRIALLFLDEWLDNFMPKPQKKKVKRKNE